MFFASFSIFAQTTFEENIIVDDSYVIRPDGAFFGDIDNDGDQDIMTAGGRNVVWFENIDGLGNYGKRKIIANYEFGVDVIFSPFLIDLDGDGDLDAIASSAIQDKIFWFENLDGLGNFSQEKVIATFNGSISSSIFVSDMDSDGDMDIISSYFYEQQKVVWIENIDGLGQFGDQHIIDVDVSTINIVKIADLDGDGDNDVILSSYYEDKIVWYENLDGNGNFGSQKLISIEQNDPTSIYPADIDNDGDLDIVSTSDLSNRIAWHENIDGNGNFTALKVIANNVDGAKGINVTDIDNDGDMDIFTAASVDNFILFYENLNGNGNFSIGQIISDNVNTPSNIQIADVDNDGLLDLMCISAKDAKLTWFKNINGQGTFGNRNVIYEDVDNVNDIYAADIDGDGDLDLLSASYNQGIHSNSLIAWFENIDGRGNFAKQTGIGYPNRAKIVRAADVDGDGDLDVIGGTNSSNIETIIWYENLDGEGSFGEVQDISNGLHQLSSLEMADFDGDGDIDILYNTPNQFGWIENVDGLGSYTITHSLSPLNGGPGPTSYPADLDNDGDMDIISWEIYGNTKLVWYENIDGLGHFGNPKYIYAFNTQGSGHLVKSADIDLDGDLDVIISLSNSPQNILWVENIDGQGNFGNERAIIPGPIHLSQISLGDLDNDNDIDLAYTKSGTDEIGWVENIDGQGNFGSELILANDALEAISVIISDLDYDGDNDIIAATQFDNKIIWYKNTHILSLYENNKLKFEIFPNPTNGLIKIESENDIKVVEIYNFLGQQVLAVQNQNDIDISSLSSGIYFLKSIDKFEVTGVKKIIKR